MLGLQLLRLLGGARLQRGAQATPGQQHRERGAERARADHRRALAPGVGSERVRAGRAGAGRRSGGSGSVAGVAPEPRAVPLRFPVAGAGAGLGVGSGAVIR